MKLLLTATALALTLTLASLNAQAQASETALGAHCAGYAHDPQALDAIELIAKHMEYTFSELCSHPRLADVTVARRVFLDEKSEPVPHLWVTLHYNEYSCQYFIREADRVITRSNCYNTW